VTARPSGRLRLRRSCEPLLGQTTVLLGVPQRHADELALRPAEQDEVALEARLRLQHGDHALAEPFHPGGLEDLDRCLEFSNMSDHIRLLHT
jgi:hypothetical protein